MIMCLTWWCGVYLAQLASAVFPAALRLFVLSRLVTFVYSTACQVGCCITMSPSRLFQLMSRGQRLSVNV